MKESENRIISLPKISDVRGNLSIIEQLKQVPFEIRRVYWIYDVPGGFDRGGHAYKESEEFIVALSGSFDVELDDGEQKQTYQLNRSYKGLYVAKAMWRRMTNFSTNSLALVLSSTDYDPDDYIMDYQDFQLWLKGQAMLTDNVNNHLFTRTSMCRLRSTVCSTATISPVEKNGADMPIRSAISLSSPPQEVSRWCSTMAPTNVPSPSTVPSGASMSRLVYGLQSRVSLRVVSVWCWPVTAMMKTTIFAIMMNFLTI